MVRKNVYRAAFWLCVAALFGGLGYASYRFIEQLGESAGNIQTQVEPPKPLGNISLEASAPVGPPAASDTGQSVSNGQDLVIQAGEFAYRNGLPQVYVLLSNQGSFTATSVYISLSLYLDGQKQPVAQVVGVPVAFEQPLAAGGTLVVSVPVGGGAWTASAVQQAQSRRLYAQVVSVSDGDRSNVDYPQTSVAVLLPQTGNDWGMPEIPPARPQIERISDDYGQNSLNPDTQAQDEPKIDVPDNRRNPHMRESRIGQRIDLEDDAAVKKLGGEQGIISVEVRESTN